MLELDNLLKQHHAKRSNMKHAPSASVLLWAGHQRMTFLHAPCKCSSMEAWSSAQDQLTFGSTSKVVQAGIGLAIKPMKTGRVRIWVLGVAHLDSAHRIGAESTSNSKRSADLGIWQRPAAGRLKPSTAKLSCKQQTCGALKMRCTANQFPGAKCQNHQEFHTCSTDQSSGYGLLHIPDCKRIGYVLD